MLTAFSCIIFLKIWTIICNFKFIPYFIIFQNFVQNILNKISFIGNTQDKKRKLENSSEFDEQEPAKIIKTDTEYPELSTIELETLAELLNYLPTTSDNK